MVPSWPVRVVAAWVRSCWVRRGRRNWEDQPAPRMRMSTGLGGGGGGAVVGCVICVILKDLEEERLDDRSFIEGLRLYVLGNLDP